MIKALVFDAYGTLYDVQTVASAVEAAFPSHGITITQVWRLKQLEYTWLRSMMGRYEDFWVVTCDALRYALATLGLHAENGTVERLAGAYNRLGPYHDTLPALSALSARRLAILSNGSPDMLAALMRHSELASRFEAVLSVDPTRSYKPDPRAYRIVEDALGVAPSEVLFVSCNGFDVAGAKSFGFRVAHIERVPAGALKAEHADAIGPTTMFKALRMQNEVLGQAADIVIASLGELPGVVAGLNAG